MASMEEIPIVEETNGDQINDYEQLVKLGIDGRVVAKLQEVCGQGKLIHSQLGAEVLIIIKDSPVEEAVTALQQFLDSDLEGVSNKSSLLCDLLQNMCIKDLADEAGESKSVNCPVTTLESKITDEISEELKPKEVHEKSGYSLTITKGQRKCGGPPPNWIGPPPPNGTEVYCGHIPYDMNENELIPLFEKCGPIWELRLMMDPLTNLSRGFAFVTFASAEAAQAAVSELNELEIKDGRRLRVNLSAPNLRLFVGNIPKYKDKSEIMQEASKVTDGLLDVIVYSQPESKWKNRGFCFLDYDSNKSATYAMHSLSSGRVKMFGSEVIVDWADPQEDPDTDVMAKVKVLYVRNLTNEFSEARLLERFEAHGPLERVKKIKDYAFIHFKERDDAVRAMEALNGCNLYGSTLDVTLSKPPGDKKKKEEMLRARERRLVSQSYKCENSNKSSLLPVTTPVSRGTRLPVRRGGFVSQPTASSARFGYSRGILNGLNSNYDYGSYQGGTADYYCSNGNVPYADNVQFNSTRGERGGRFGSVVRGVNGRCNGVRGDNQRNISMDCSTPPHWIGHSKGSSLSLAGRNGGETRGKWRGAYGKTKFLNSNQENY